MRFITRIYQIVSSPADPDNVRMAAESVPLNGIELYCETEGAGEPLLLLHGGTGCQENWAHAGRDKFVREYTLIKSDARGHGRSTNPGKTITHRQCALDTLALLDHLGIRKCRAIGLSMGETFFFISRPCSRIELKPWFSSAPLCTFRNRHGRSWRKSHSLLTNRLQNGRSCANATSTATSRLPLSGIGHAA